MTAESGVKWLLRFISFTTIFALIAAVAPQSWLVYWANQAAPGTPVGILFTYLARMLMATYAFVGLLCFLVSTDIRRYLPLIWVMGAGSVACAVVGLIVLFVAVPPDQRTGFFWLVFGDFAEGLAQGLLLLGLLLRIALRSACN